MLFYWNKILRVLLMDLYVVIIVDNNNNYLIYGGI